MIYSSNFVQEVLESLKDADQAIEEAFDSKIKLSIGESFVETDEDQAKVYVEKMRKKYQNEKTINMEKYNTNKKRLDHLKVILYSKFGKRLRLDED